MRELDTFHVFLVTSNYLHSSRHQHSDPVADLLLNRLVSSIASLNNGERLRPSTTRYALRNAQIIQTVRFKLSLDLLSKTHSIISYLTPLTLPFPNFAKSAKFPPFSITTKTLQSATFCYPPTHLTLHLLQYQAQKLALSSPTRSKTATAHEPGTKQQ